MKNHPNSQYQNRLPQLPGLARGSCSWLDAIGSGYAVGPTGAVLRHVSTATRNGYCR